MIPSPKIRRKGGNTLENHSQILEETRIQDPVQFTSRKQYKTQKTMNSTRSNIHKDTISNETCILSNHPFALVTKT